LGSLSEKTPLPYPYFLFALKDYGQGFCYIRIRIFRAAWKESLKGQENVLWQMAARGVADKKPPPGVFQE